MSAGHTLDPAEVRAYYDRFGEKQDGQGFYEDPALDDLVAHGCFDQARSVFEFGCGTGKLAARLLAAELPAEATYLGCDLSEVMVGLARERTADWSDRARIERQDGGVDFPCADHSVDRVVCTWVLDLLGEKDIEHVLDEGHRVLRPGGRACFASLTEGPTFGSRIVSSAWSAVFRLKPDLVGGCRPVRLREFVGTDQWEIVHDTVVTPWMVPSEVLVLAVRG